MYDFHLVYILKSIHYPKHYIGVTSNLIARMTSHNELGKKGYTIKYRPWKVVHIEVFDSRGSALKREKFLKSGQGRFWLTNNINNY